MRFIVVYLNLQDDTPRLQRHAETIGINRALRRVVTGAVGPRR